MIPQLQFFWRLSSCIGIDVIAGVAVTIARMLPDGNILCFMVHPCSSATRQYKMDVRLEVNYCRVEISTRSKRKDNSQEVQ